MTRAATIENRRWRRFFTSEGRTRCRPVWASTISSDPRRKHSRCSIRGSGRERQAADD